MQTNELLIFNDIIPKIKYNLRLITKRLIIPLLLFSSSFTSSAEEIKKEVKDENPRGLPKWEGHLTLDLKAGNYRKIAQPIIFMPLLQNEISMLFLDLRGMTDTTPALEGNVALAYRCIYNNWIFGGYGFFDRRRTQFGNLFNQLTFGVEAFNPLWEARFNSYFPLTAAKIIPSLTNTVSQSKASGYNRTIVKTETSSYDTPLGGFDAEVGYEFFKSFRLLLGGYHFKGKGVSAINGARLRFTYNVVEHEGIKFALQGETQYDSQRKGIHYIGFKLTFPIGNSRYIYQGSKFTAVEKMMTRDIVRDVDIQSEKAGKKRVLVATKTVTNQEDRKTVFMQFSDTGTGDILGEGTVEDPYCVSRNHYDQPTALQIIAGGQRDFHDVAIVDGPGLVEYRPVLNIPPLPPEIEIAASPPHHAPLPHPHPHHAPPPHPHVPPPPPRPHRAPPPHVVQPPYIQKGWFVVGGKRRPVYVPNPLWRKP